MGKERNGGENNYNGVSPQARTSFFALTQRTKQEKSRQTIPPRSATRLEFLIKVIAAIVNIISSKLYIIPFLPIPAKSLRALYKKFQAFRHSQHATIAFVTASPRCFEKPRSLVIICEGNG